MFDQIESGQTSARIPSLAICPLLRLCSWALLLLALSSTCGACSSPCACRSERSRRGEEGVCPSQNWRHTSPHCAAELTLRSARGTGWSWIWSWRALRVSFPRQHSGRALRVSLPSQHSGRGVHDREYLTSSHFLLGGACMIEPRRGRAQVVVDRNRTQVVGKSTSG